MTHLPAIHWRPERLRPCERAGHPLRVQRLQRLRAIQLPSRRRALHREPDL